MTMFLPKRPGCRLRRAGIERAVVIGVVGAAALAGAACQQNARTEHYRAVAERAESAPGDGRVYVLWPDPSAMPTEVDVTAYATAGSSP